MMIKRVLIVSDMGDVQTRYNLPAGAKLPVKVADFFLFQTVEGVDVIINAYDVGKMELQPEA